MLWILLVEDDTTIASGLQYFLEQEGYGVTVCGCRAQAESALRERRFDLALLDLSLPDGSGYDVCKTARERCGGLPVLFLTACDEEAQVVMALDMGADDYVTKPFRMRELLSRIRSVLRRYGKGGAHNAVAVFENVRVHTAEARVFKAEKEVFLTALEYRLLLFFIQHTGQVLTRMQLLESIWDVAGDFVNDNTLTVYIKRLREKLEDDPQHPQLIRTVRGLGYQIGG